MPTRRQERINARIVQLLANEFTLLSDPRLGFITVVRADVAPDMRDARVYVSIFGDESVQQRSMDTLEKLNGHMRKVLAHGLNMRITPRIHFILDRSAELMQHLSEVIREARTSDSDAAAAIQEAPQEQPKNNNTNTQKSSIRRFGDEPDESDSTDDRA